jgi:hypothetical protein
MCKWEMCSEHYLKDYLNKQLPVLFLNPSDLAARGRRHITVTINFLLKYSTVQLNYTHMMILIYYMKYTRHTIYSLVFIKLPGDLLFCLFRFIFCGTLLLGKRCSVSLLMMLSSPW